MSLPFIHVYFARNTSGCYYFNVKMTETQKLENRAIIKFCCNLGMTSTKTFEKNAENEQREYNFTITSVYLA